jgi:hypothetical protein
MMAITVALIIGMRRIKVCWEAEEVYYNVVNQSFPSIQI